MKRGFTLVELLVAVLIIGVLTAMALPMYRKSVDKSRYATLMPLAKNIKDAQEAFYLGGGKYSKDLGSLDVRVPGNPSGNTAILSDGTTVEISNTDGTGYVKMGKENLNNYYVMYQDRSSSYPGEIHCEALTDSDRANELCQNLGGTKIDNSLTSGYTDYVLLGTGENAGNTVIPAKRIVSTESCGEGCTKGIYDDGTSVWRRSYNSGVYTVESWVENAAGTRIADEACYWYPSTGRHNCSIGVGEGGATHVSFGEEETVTEIYQQDAPIESAYSGETYEGYYVRFIPAWGEIGISYGDSMRGNSESYTLSDTDGSWKSAQVVGNDGENDWWVFYNDGSIERESGNTEAVKNAWAAAGYSTDPASIAAWVSVEKDKIIAAYCELDPDNSYFC